MTLKQWLIHLWFWIRSFPKLHVDDHLWVGPAGAEEFECLICGAYLKDD